MTDTRLRELLTEVADDVEPGDRLDAIRARSRTSRRRLWVPAGAALVAASIVGAVALSGAPTERADAPGPADTSSLPADDSPEPPQEGPDPSETGQRRVAVHYVGVTPDGPRLYPEPRRLSGVDPFAAAVEALATPLDPDYSSLWPAHAVDGVSFDGVGADGQISVALVDRAFRNRPAGMTEVEAGLAVEQVVRTLQPAAQAPAGVRFHVDGEPLDQLPGRPVPELLTPGPDADVLADVSISAPAEGDVVDNDGPLLVSGATSSASDLLLEVETLTGTVTSVAPVTGGWDDERVHPFSMHVDISRLEPGQYVVTARTDDRSGEQRYHVDDRLITVTD